MNYLTLAWVDSISLPQKFRIVRRKKLKDLLASLVTIFSAFSTRPIEIKKALKFLSLLTVNGSDKKSMSSTSISSKLSSFGLLSGLNLIA